MSENLLHLGLVSLGCSTKVLFTGWFMNNRNLFLRVLESESPREGDGQIRGPGVSPLIRGS